MINEERYVLAEFKRRLVNQYNKAEKYSNRKDVLLEALVTLAAIEADVVLGEDFETEPEPAYENDEEGEA